jgi:hypothetical protein
MGMIGLRNPVTLALTQSASAVTATPTIGTLGCTTESGVNSVTFNVTNNDGSTATIQAADNSSFIGAQSVSVASGASGSFSFSGYSNPPGSVTFYARATASGKTVSNTASRTQTINGCFGF